MTVTKRSPKTKRGIIPFTVVREVKGRDVESALISAFEGGSGYWINELVPKYDAKTVERVLQGSFDLMVVDEENKKHMLSRVKIHKGLKLMSEIQPKHFANLVSDDGSADATTGDVLLQLCLLGEVIYG